VLAAAVNLWRQLVTGLVTATVTASAAGSATVIVVTSAAVHVGLVDPSSLSWCIQKTWQTVKSSVKVAVKVLPALEPPNSSSTLGFS
jgi:ethanolamine utilization microcompartment shell protein EutS